MIYQLEKMVFGLDRKNVQTLKWVPKSLLSTKLFSKLSICNCSDHLMGHFAKDEIQIDFFVVVAPPKW